jgi:hypothetical protein
MRLTVPAYSEDALPPELAALPAEKPGSRKLVLSEVEGAA